MSPRIKTADELEGFDIPEEKLQDLFDEDDDVNDLRIDSDAEIEEVLHPVFEDDVLEDGDEENMEIHDFPHEGMSVEIDGMPEVDTAILEFSLPHVPGAKNQDDIEIDEEEQEEEEQAEFLDRLFKDADKLKQDFKEVVESVPEHSGNHILGIDRAVSFLEHALGQLSKAIRSDVKGKFNLEIAGKIEEELQNGIDRLKERKELLEAKEAKKRPKKVKTRKKAADEENEGLIKEAQRVSGVNKTTIVVPLFISALARTCINAKVSNGRDIEDVFEKLCKLYKLTDREKLELVQLMDDMGYSEIRMDRGYLVGEDVDPTSVDNVEWPQRLQS